MPEMPEVESLRVFLTDKLVGRTITRLDVVAFSALKTYDPPPATLYGLEIDGVSRHGKFLDISAQGCTWSSTWPGPGGCAGRTSSRRRHPRRAATRSRSDCTWTTAPASTSPRRAPSASWPSTWSTDPAQIPHVATLGPDPLADDFDRAALAALLAKAGRSQLKGVLKDQRVIAGIGNAYSDEILHVARMSPFKPASSLSDEELTILYDAIRTELTGAIQRAEGLAAKDLKSEKKSGMRVHGRKGEPCPVCGDTIAEVSFADSSLQYCPTCQTGGKKLADRRMSRLLK